MIYLSSRVCTGSWIARLMWSVFCRLQLARGLKYPVTDGIVRLVYAFSSSTGRKRMFRMSDHLSSNWDLRREVLPFECRRPPEARHCWGHRQARIARDQHIQHTQSMLQGLICRNSRIPLQERPVVGIAHVASSCIREIDMLHCSDYSDAVRKSAADARHGAQISVRSS